MKKLLFAIIAFAAVFSFAACSDNETYADLRNRELDSIAAFLKNENITVISEDEFTKRFKEGKTLTEHTNGKNEYVLFNSNGVYMQVLEQGCGDFIKSGETADVLVRFDEYNVNTRAKICKDSWTHSNKVAAYSYYIDKMTVTNTTGTFQATFDTKTSLMATAHASQSYGVSGVVPSGWLVPFTWIKVGRPQTDAERVAHVRLLIPHSYGTTTASGSVNAYFYDLLIQRGR